MTKVLLCHDCHNDSHKEDKLFSIRLSVYSYQKKGSVKIRYSCGFKGP